MNSLAKRITLLGFAANLLLGITKTGFGLLANSQGLVADGIHSLSDLLTDSLVYVATHFGGQHPDPEHPYGHAKIETVATIIMGCILLIASFSLIYDAWWHIRYAHIVIPHSYAIGIALVSVGINEWLYHATMRVAVNTRSELLKINALHHRSDAASSLIVIVGIIATLLGYIYLDAIAAVCVALLIAKMAISMILSSFHELIDTAVDPEMLKQIQQAIHEIAEVQEIHQLRTRLMGGKILVDVHVLVDSHLTVSEGHHISHQVHRSLRKKIPLISDVIVHIDPEDDETHAPNLHLPSRQQLLPELQQAWQHLPGFNKIKNIRLHYLDGKIFIDVYLPLEILDTMKNAETIKQDYQQALAGNKYPLQAMVYFG